MRDELVKTKVYRAQLEPRHLATAEKCSLIISNSLTRPKIWDAEWWYAILRVAYSMLHGGTPTPAPHELTGLNFEIEPVQTRA